MNVNTSSEDALYKTPLQAARTIMERCDELAHCSESADEITRTFLSAPMHTVHEKVTHWMHSAGMKVHVDALGNIRGTLPAHNGSTSPAFVIGSHLDTVKNAGKYDGILGVLLGIAVAELLHQSQERLNFALQVIGFSEEEGVRFQAPYLGSLAYTGAFAPRYLELRDTNGHSLAHAISDFGLEPMQWPDAARPANEILGYLEAHIEQGPVLEQLEEPLGVVSAIAGQSRLQMRFKGQPGHAGTLPMNARHDAFAALCEWTLRVEQLASKTEGAVATVGRVEVVPNVPNVVPGEVAFSLDVRHQNDGARHDLLEKLLQEAATIAERRGILCALQGRSSQNAVPMDTDLCAMLEEAIEQEIGHTAPTLVSGAGHDAAVVANIAPCAMLFLRTPGGASHCPLEAVWEKDVSLAIGAMKRFLGTFNAWQIQ